MRRLIAFPCAGETLVGTLDTAAGRAGLLIVSGGNEIRCGAHRGMAELAQRLAARDYPVFRFDRRGIGDASGTNAGYASAAPDIAAAAATFMAEAELERIVAFGNCDAATALALFHADLPLDALVLANPWVIEDSDDLPPAPAIRAHYRARLRDPRIIAQALRGDLDFARLFSGVRKLLTKQPANQLAAAVHRALSGATVPIEIVLAEHDATAIAFATTWEGTLPVRRIASASHSFADPGDAVALEEILVAALSR